MTFSHQDQFYDAEKSQTVKKTEVANQLLLFPSSSPAKFHRQVTLFLSRARFLH